MPYHNNNNKTLTIQNKEKLKKAAKEKTKLTYKGKQSKQYLNFQGKLKTWNNELHILND